MLRLGLGLAGVLGVDEGVIHGPAQFRGHVLTPQPPRRALTSIRHLAADLLFPNILAGQKPAGRAPVLLQYRQQQVPRIRPAAPEIPRQLDGALQHLFRLARKTFAPSCTEMFQESHGLLPSRRCSPLRQQLQYRPVGRKKISCFWRRNPNRANMGFSGHQNRVDCS